MLTHPTHERLITLGLTGMAKALEEQRRSPDLDALSFEERVGLLVDREAAERDTKRLTTRLKFAALRQSACVEDVDWRTPRGIDRAVFARTRRRRLDRPQREPAHHRGNRARQKLDRLRPRPQGLPRQSFGPVSPRPAPVRGACPRARRRSLWPPAQNHRPSSTPDPRRLGPFGSQSARTARPAGDPR